MQNKYNLTRRNWLKSAGIISAASILSPIIYRCTNTKKILQHPTILVVSGWQDVNIGDIAHTPGLLHVLEVFLPEANIILWKKSKGTVVEDMLKTDFPKVKIIHGNVDSNKDVDTEEVRDAFESADFCLHGSGPSVVGASNLQAWVKHTDKPFGIFGVTIQQVSDQLKELLQKASFVFTRESASLEVLNENGITNPVKMFAPDATFFMNIHDEQRAKAFLKDNDLEDRKFICAIPRLRYTPYYKFKDVNWSEERIKMVNEVNAENKEKDHAKLRMAMIAWVRNTGNKVLVCPEMTYEVNIMDELLIDPLPAEVKPHVIKRGYWLPDEAASIYAKAHTVLSFECHSPIISVANNTPTFYLRQPQDTIKGQMYYDLSMKDWVFEIDETEGKQIEDELMWVVNNYDQAQEKLRQVNLKVHQIYSEATAILNTDLKKV